MRKRSQSEDSAARPNGQRPAACSGVMVPLAELQAAEEHVRLLCAQVRDLEAKLAAMTAGKPHEAEERVIESIRLRREVGRRKYGTTMERADLSAAQWAQHAQEEALDFAIYLERLKRDLQNTQAQGPAAQDKP